MPHGHVRRHRTATTRFGGLVLAAVTGLTAAGCGAEAASGGGNEAAARSGHAATAATAAPAAAPASPKAGTGAGTPAPASEYGTPAPSQARVRAALRRIEADYRGRIGAFAIDTGTGRTVGHRADERFPSNSTVKAPLCGAVLRHARTEDPGLMDRTLTWRERDVQRNSPVTDTPAAFDKGLTASQLCHATVTTSDNTAANVLLEQIGGPAAMTRFYRSLGDRHSRMDRPELALNNWQPGEQRDTVTPAAMARDLRELSLGKALTAPDRKRFTGWLKANTTGDDRIRAGLPDTWTVGDKTGTGFAGRGEYAAAGDIAVAWPSDGGEPLVLAVYINRTRPGGSIDQSVIAKTATLLAAGLGRVPFPEG